MASIERKFTIRHEFADFVKSTSDGNEIKGKTEKHFGCFWNISALGRHNSLKNRIDGYFFSLYCKKPRVSREWSVDTKFELLIESKQGMETIECRSDRFNCTHSEFVFVVEFQDLKKCLVDGKLGVEFHVSINKMIGMQLFDESMRKYSDVVLIVENEKFYVLKLFLASQSSYFESLLLGDFKESKQSEVPLSGISAADFQNYLEALHGHSVIDDKTVTGMLKLANMYDTPSILQKCQIFLIEHSKKSMKEKLCIAGEYQLSELKYDCFHKIKTVDDIRAAVPSYSAGVDHDILAHLFDKLLELQPTTTAST